MSFTNSWADLQWSQQHTHLQCLLSENPPRKDKIIQQLDKMVEGVTSYEKEERIRDLQGIARSFLYDGTKGGWKGVDGYLVGAGTYSWESSEQGEKQERRRAGERTDSETSAVTLVGDEEKGDNLGERKSPMTVEVRGVRERDSEVGENRKSNSTATGGQGEHLSKEERKEEIEEIKARMKAADLELKRIVPAVCKYPKLLAMLTFLPYFIGSSVILAGGIIMVIAGKRVKDDAPADVKKDAKRLQIISDGLVLGGMAVYLLSITLFHKALLDPLARRVMKMYEERCTICRDELVALGCEDLEDRAERSAEENEVLGGSMKAAVFRRVYRTLVPFVRLEFAFILGIPIISFIMLFAA